ncbi:MAG: winged helix-turn-helix domain-containing protein [Armatimonadetes bacterium]|nr:winged helix-turn-helix domain-containing protein [Armatimonadota bacterium]
MNADEQFLQSIHDGDWEACRFALNRLEQEVVEAIQTTGGERLEPAEIELASVMRVLRSEAASESAQPYLNIGVLSGFHRILRALREDKPSHSDLTFARTKNRTAFLRTLREGVALCAQDILERTSMRHQSTVSEVGKDLEEAGLVRRDRTGKGSPYLLTLRGSLVARHLDEEQIRWQADQISEDSSQYHEWGKMSLRFDSAGLFSKEPDEDFMALWQEFRDRMPMPVAASELDSGQSLEQLQFKLREWQRAAGTDIDARERELWERKSEAPSK